MSPRQLCPDRLPETVYLLCYPGCAYDTLCALDLRQHIGCAGLLSKRLAATAADIKQDGTSSLGQSGSCTLLSPAQRGIVSPVCTNSFAATHSLGTIMAHVQ